MSSRLSSIVVIRPVALRGLLIILYSSCFLMGASRLRALDATVDPAYHSPGADTYVNTVAETATDIYYGGLFQAFGSTPAANIVRFNKAASTWHPLGFGVDGEVNKILISGTDVYAAGFFHRAGDAVAHGIAKWNGTNWSGLGGGLTRDSIFDTGGRDMVFKGTDLYVGGLFEFAGGVPAINIARWDGTQWFAMGTGGSDGGFDGIRALIVYNNQVHAGGSFTNIGGVAITNIARWDGTTWQALHSSGVSSTVNAMAVIGTDLYLGGEFTTAGTLTTSRYLTKWNGSTFSSLGGNMGSSVESLAVSGSVLYAGGFFQSVPGVASARRIASWNGSTWSALGAGMDGDVLSMRMLQSGSLLAGGKFAAAGTVAASGAALWNGAAWAPVITGKGVAGPYRSSSSVPNIRVLTDAGAYVYAGGTFTTAGPVLANSIARYEKSTGTWSALGGGITWDSIFANDYPIVSAILVDGTNVYAGGRFPTAGGTSVQNIAKWDGTSWTAMGAGFNGYVFAFVKHGSDIYAAGNFSASGATSTANIARWNGSSWSPVGNGVSGGYVNALASINGDLYAGGYFTKANGTLTTVNGIAKWNGSTWSALGSGMTHEETFPFVSAIALYNGELHACGMFDKAGNVAASSIARWNGTAWQPLGKGLDWEAHCFSLSGNKLFVGGGFNYAGGEPAHGLGVWDGTKWQEMIDDLDVGDSQEHGVSALVVENETTAYIGGGLSLVNGIPARSFARTALAPSSGRPVVSAILEGQFPNATAHTIQVTVNPKGSAATAKLEYGTTQLLGSSKTIPLSPNNGTVSKIIAVALTGLQSGTQYFYRVSATNGVGTTNSAIETFTTRAPARIDAAPSSQLVAQGMDVTLSVVASGDSFLDYQWLKKNVAIAGATDPIYQLNDITLAQASDYSVRVENYLGTTTSPAAKIGVVDTTPKSPPVVELTTFSFTAPAAGTGLKFQWYKHDVLLADKDLGGRVSGAKTAKLSITKFAATDLDYYTCKVSLGDLELDTGHITPLLQSKPQVAALAAGSLPQWYAGGEVNAPITALISILDPLPQNQPTKYGITGLPKGVFYNTTTGALSGRPTVSGDFKVRITASNAAGIAPPVEVFPLHVNPLPALVVGTFNGLVDRNAALNNNCGGSLNVVTTIAGGFSGSVVLLSKKCGFSGVLNASLSGGDATASVPVKLNAATTLTLAVTLNASNGQLTGTLTGPAAASVKAWRNPWRTAAPANPATALAAHPYTAALRMTTPNASESQPQGEGYLQLSLTAAGVATWKGRMADGTSVTTWTTTMGPGGEIPVHLMLYGNTGSIQGWQRAAADISAPPASYANNTLDNLAGENTTWFKNAQAPASTTRYYKDGIPLHNVTVIGGAWPKLVSPNLVLSLSDASATNNARLTFSLAGVEASALGAGTPIVQALRIKAPTNTPVLPSGAANPASVKLTLAAGTGLINGSFALKDANPLGGADVPRTALYYGVLVKRLNQGVGHFLLPKLPAVTGEKPTTTKILSGKVVFGALP